MENGSKALIIAGAILLAILIIGLGVYIYNQASNTVSDTGMDQIAVRQFNAQFEPYIMDNASGAIAMALYDAVQIHNAGAPDVEKVTLRLSSGKILDKDDSKPRRDGIDEIKKTAFTNIEDEVKMIKLAQTSEKPLPEEDNDPPSFPSGLIDAEEFEYINFSKSELSTTKRYNITVGRYDAGVIKEIDIEVVR